MVPLPTLSARALESKWVRRGANLIFPVLILILVADLSRRELPPAAGDLEPSPGFALYFQGNVDLVRGEPNRQVTAADLTDPVKRKYKILGILCRDSRDRSVFLRDRKTGEDRLCRIGDFLVGTRVADIQPAFVLLERQGVTARLQMFSEGKVAVEAVPIGQR